MVDLVCMNGTRRHAEQMAFGLWEMYSTVFGNVY